MANELNVSKFLKEVALQKVMGPILDLARVSNMGDRQFNQFQRSVKNHMYSVIENSNKVLCEYDKFITQSDILIEEEPEKED